MLACGGASAAGPYGVGRFDLRISGALVTPECWPIARPEKPAIVAPPIMAQDRERNRRRWVPDNGPASAAELGLPATGLSSSHRVAAAAPAPSSDGSAQVRPASARVSA